MFVRLFVCLVFITKIVASDYHTTSQYESSSIYIKDNQRNTRKLVTDTLNDSAGGTTKIKNVTANKTNATESSITAVPITTGQDKIGTTTKKPVVNKEGMETQSSQIVNSYPPYISYEVTENVIDIPDDRTPAGPIVTNYTHQPPILNLARPTNKTDTDKTTEDKPKTKNNRLSILHINAEFDDKHEVSENKVVGIFKGIKEYIHSFQKGIVNGFRSLFHKHQDLHDHGERFERPHHDAHDHEERFKRAVEGGRVESGVQNVDKIEYNVHRRYISKI